MLESSIISFNLMYNIILNLDTEYRIQIRCLDLHFSDRTVRIIEIFAKIPNQVV
jgi:hypothetical protein